MTEQEKKPKPERTALRRTLLTGGGFVLGFVVLALISIQGWEFSNSVSFCANTCHDVHPEEPAAYQDSYHARVKCTECHMGRQSTIRSIFIKASHFRHLPEVLLHHYDRPLRSDTMRPANESCERCHWPPAFHGDTVRQILSYLPDQENTEKRVYLILKTGGGERERGLGYGIHWHIENPVEFIATDEQKQDIRWVRTTLPDGRTVEYNDAADPLPAEELALYEPKLMDCVDCHNRVGHPFPYPEQAADQAIADGLVSQELPYAKQEMLNLLSAPYPDQESALLAVDTVRQQYEQAYPEVAAAFPGDIERAAQAARDLLPRLVFTEPGVTWQSFPNNSGHKEFAGCFRCHDGKHLSDDGQSIRLHCNICHSLPQTVAGVDRPPQMPVATLQEPASHLATSFMADHRFQANESCATCHGEIAFGADDSSFCANSACHGQAWPSVELDAAFVHPIELAGKHAEAWCHDCHAGVARPEYRCANCHRPPLMPHFGEECEDCHSPVGFDQVDLAGFEHPVPLVGAHAAASCLACHARGFELTFDCTRCHQPPASHPQADCDTCHAPVGWAESAASTIGAAPAIPHPLENVQECLLCHATDALTRPAPANHEGLASNQCQLCHQPSR